MKTIIMTRFQKFQAFIEDDHKAGIVAVIGIATLIIISYVVINVFHIGWISKY